MSQNKRLVNKNEFEFLVNSSRISLNFQANCFKNITEYDSILRIDTDLNREFFNKSLTGADTSFIMHFFIAYTIHNFYKENAFINALILILNFLLVKKSITIPPGSIYCAKTREMVTTKEERFFIGVELTDEFKEKGLFILKDEIPLNKNDSIIVLVNTSNKPIKIYNDQALFNACFYWK